MAATRLRVAPLLEWVCAVVLIVAALAASAFLLQNARGVRAVTMTPVIAHEAPAPVPPSTLTSGAVAVPMLPLPGGKTLRVGDRASRLSDLVNVGAQRGEDVVERDGSGERITRVYDDNGTSFAVVIQAPRPGGEPLIIGIYRQ